VTPPGAEPTPRPRDAGSPWTPPGERVEWRFRPSPWFIVLRPLGWLILIALLGLAAALVPWPPPLAGWRPHALLTCAGAALLVLGWSALEWAARDYLLSERRVVWVSGVLRRLVVEAPLERIQTVVLYRSLRERLAGLGTLGFASAGTDSVEVVWAMIERPRARLRQAQQKLDEVRHKAPVPPAAATGDPGLPAPPAGRRLPVIGLAGGIGAGKSAVARAMARQGCVVVDSDAQAKALLDEPAVRAELVRWWGSGILAAEGRVERPAVARIVFTDPAQRRRLEGLVHPLVRAERNRVRDRARADGARALVIDAPLLFEAGVDAECDAVVFVEAPRAVRLERVRARGWDEAELARREAAQLPLAEKRRRSTHVIVNDAGPEDLERRVAEVLALVAPVPAGAVGAPPPRESR